MPIHHATHKMRMSQKVMQPQLQQYRTIEDHQVDMNKPVAPFLLKRETLATVGIIPHLPSMTYYQREISTKTVRASRLNTFEDGTPRTGIAGELAFSSSMNNNPFDEHIKQLIEVNKKNSNDQEALLRDISAGIKRMSPEEERSRVSDMTRAIGELGRINTESDVPKMSNEELVDRGGIVFNKIREFEAKARELEGEFGDDDDVKEIKDLAKEYQEEVDDIIKELERRGRVEEGKRKNKDKIREIEAKRKERKEEIENVKALQSALRAVSKSRGQKELIESSREVSRRASFVSMFEMSEAEGEGEFEMKETEKEEVVDDILTIYSKVSQLELNQDQVNEFKTMFNTIPESILEEVYDNIISGIIPREKINKYIGLQIALKTPTFIKQEMENHNLTKNQFLERINQYIESIKTKSPTPLPRDMMPSKSAKSSPKESPPKSAKSSPKESPPKSAKSSPKESPPKSAKSSPKESPPKSAKSSPKEMSPKSKQRAQEMEVKEEEEPEEEEPEGGTITTTSSLRQLAEIYFGIPDKIGGRGYGEKKASADKKRLQILFDTYTDPDSWKGLSNDEIKEAFDKYENTVIVPKPQSTEAYLKHRKVEYLKSHWIVNKKLPTIDEINDLKDLSDANLTSKFGELARAQGLALGRS
jgi:hypothetical protein